MHDDKSAVNAGALTAVHAQAPRLQAGGVGYAAWAPHMDVFLQRGGAEGIHRKEMLETTYVQLSKSVESWADEALAAAIAHISVPVSSSSSSSSATTDTKTVTPAATHKIDDETKAQRRIITTTVERSRKVYGTIYSALPEELRVQAAHITPGWAYGLWHWLEVKYQSTEEDSVGELLQQWTTLRQEDGESFDAYRARVNKLRELLKNAKEAPSARMYAYMMLDRLQPRYKQAVLALKAGGQLKDASVISWDTVTAFINAHERSESRLDGELDGVHGHAMAASSMGRTPAAGPTMIQRPAQALRPGNRDAGAGGPRTLADVQCFTCKEFGHFRSECPKRVPSGQDKSGPRKKPSFGQRRAAEQAKAAQAPGGRYDVMSDDSDDHAGIGPRPSTYAAIVIRGLGHLAAATRDRTVTFEKPKTKVVVPVTNTPGRAASTPAKVSAPQVVATIPKSVLKRAPTIRKKVADVGAAAAEPCNVKALSNEAFGIDTMASLHATGNKNMFVGPLKKCDPIYVKMANHTVIAVTQYGMVNIKVRAASGKTVKIPIAKVHFHEQFSTNLLSWGLLYEEGWQMHSVKPETYVLTPGGNKICLRTGGRVSVLDSEVEVGSEQVYALGDMMSPNVEELVKLHERLGHLTFKRMVHLIKGGATLDVTKVHATDHELREAKQRIAGCKACIQGKGMRTPFGHRGLDTGKARGETLHMDTYQVQRVQGNRKWLEYGLTVTDPFTQWRWFCALQSKDQVAKEVVAIVRHAQTQLDCKVKRLYADGGTEFINKTLRDWCRDHGIALHYTPARTQQLNGIAENAVRSNKDAVRTQLIHGNVPLQFWVNAACHTTFVWNRAHVSPKTGTTPYEAMYGKKPSARHWGIFGVDAEMRVPKDQRDAFGAATEPCIYLGHHNVQNCAMVYVVRTRKVVASRDVKYGSTFTHCEALRRGLDVLAPDSDQPEPAAIPVAGPAVVPAEQRYDVEAVIDQRTRRDGTKEYLVRWTGYDGEDTWQPADQMKQDAPEAVREFLESRSEDLDDNSQPSESDSGSVADSESEDHDSESSQSDDEAPAVAEVPPVRRSGRNHLSSRALDRPQVRMAMCAISDISDWALPDATTAIACAVSQGVSILEKKTPSTYREAMASPEGHLWKGGMDKEIGSCEAKEVWEEVDRKDLPKGANILPVKWVYRIKTDGNGSLTEYKARVTPKGYRQKEGRDYFEVFARTGMYKTLRFGLSLAARFDYELNQLDIPTAFLNADVEEEVYMEVPEGYREGREGKVLRLKKAMYGLKQAPRNWNLLIDGFITKEMDFKASVSDPCLYFRRSRSGRLMLLFLFVDDFQCGYHREDQEEWNQLKSKLVERFKAKDMGESNWILGMRITRDRKAGTITLDQELYVTKALEKYGFAQCRTAPTPEVVGAAHQEPKEKQAELADKQRYMEIVGTLMYAAISTRPDIAHAVYYLAAHMLEPLKLHMDAAERVLRYLAGTPDLGLVFGSRNQGFGDSRGHTQINVDVCAYADADWANDKSDRRSITGWVSKVNGDPISWSSKKQRTVALSTCEAELYASAAAIQEVLWVRGLVKELGLRTDLGSVVHGDNQSSIAVIKNGVKGERTKHVDVKYHFVTETVDRGDVQLKWVASSAQHADIFTKALPVPVFEQLRDQLMSC
jgi:hypothetical protein